MYAQAELQGLLTDYVGRESPLYFAERLSEHLGNDVKVGNLCCPLVPTAAALLSRPVSTGYLCRHTDGACALRLDGDGGS